MPDFSVISSSTNAQIKRRSAGQSAAEYVIVLCLAAIIAASSYDLFSRALGAFYNRLLSARTGTAGMAP